MQNPIMPKILKINYEFELGGTRVTTPNLHEFRTEAAKAVKEIAQRYFEVTLMTMGGEYSYLSSSWWEVEEEFKEEGE